MSDLSILCVTKLEPFAARFIDALLCLSDSLDAEFVLVLDGEVDGNGWPVAKRVSSNGDIGSVLDEALEVCTRTYVLRLDDDERASQGMVQWLVRREYETAQHWKFPRAHLWSDEHHILATPHLWPDHQTRLSWKKFSGNREPVHAGSPYGGGTPAPCAIEHHKFLVRTLEQRRKMVARYDAIQPGAGSRFRMFSAPEDFYKPEEIAAAIRHWHGESIEQVAA